MCFSMPKVEMPKVETTAREILPSWESNDVESPVLGTDSDFQEVALKRGKSNLKILPVADTTETKSETGSYSSYYSI